MLNPIFGERRREGARAAARRNEKRRKEGRRNESAQRSHGRQHVEGRKRRAKKNKVETPWDRHQTLEIARMTGKRLTDACGIFVARSALTAAAVLVHNHAGDAKGALLPRKCQRTLEFVYFAGRRGGSVDSDFAGGRRPLFSSPRRTACAGRARAPVRTGMQPFAWSLFLSAAETTTKDTTFVRFMRILTAVLHDAIP